MNYLSPQEILYIHYRLTQELNGAQGVHNLPILKKLIKYLHNNDAFPDKFSKASALFFGIAKKKPFLDLNKESSLFLTKMFLSLNGSDFNIESPETVNFVKNQLSNATIEDIKKFIIQNSTPLN